jgi:hypothetical protein
VGSPEVKQINVRLIPATNRDLRASLRLPTKMLAFGSGYQLTNAFNINDRGEILAKAAKVGFTPDDDTDLGHRVLWVPCQSIDESGCSGSAQAGAIAYTSAKLGPSPMRPLHGTAWQAQLAPRLRMAAGAAKH